MYNADGEVKVLVVDLGLKNNQLRCLLKRRACVTVVPWDHPLDPTKYDGLFLSNGPGEFSLLFIYFFFLLRLCSVAPYHVWKYSSNALLQCGALVAEGIRLYNENS